MIVRQVKLTIESSLVFDFLEFFNSVKKKIEYFPGCLKLELYQDIKQKKTFFSPPAEVCSLVNIYKV